MTLRNMGMSTTSMIKIASERENGRLKTQILACNYERAVIWNRKEKKKEKGMRFQ